MNWIWGWDAVAAIAQAAEAGVVLVGLILVMAQLKQLRREQKASDWEALRWALSLLSVEDIYRFNEMLSLDMQPEDEESARLLPHIAHNLELIGRAMKDNYLKPELYFMARPEIAQIYQDEFRNHAEPKYLELVELYLGATTPAGYLIGLARKWQIERDQKERHNKR